MVGMERGWLGAGVGVGVWVPCNSAVKPNKGQLSFPLKYV